MKRLSGYHHFMDGLRKEGNLWFYCACGTAVPVQDKPMLMKCFCNKYMVVVDEKDLP